MFIKTTLVSAIGMALILAQVSSQLPLNSDFLSSEDARENLKIQQRGPERLNPGTADRRIHGLATRGQDSAINEVEPLKVATSKYLVQEFEAMQAMRSLQDENRRYGKVTIGFPNKVVKMLDQLSKDISWGLFQELYGTSSESRKQALESVRKDVGY